MLGEGEGDLLGDLDSEGEGDLDLLGDLDSEGDLDLLGDLDLGTALEGDLPRRGEAATLTVASDSDADPASEVSAGSEIVGPSTRSDPAS
jgi:hypothetical protein